MKLYIACNYQDYQTWVAGVYSDKDTAFKNAKVLQDHVGGDIEIDEFELDAPFDITQFVKAS